MKRNKKKLIGMGILLVLILLTLMESVSADYGTWDGMLARENPPFVGLGGYKVAYFIGEGLLIVDFVDGECVYTYMKAAPLFIPLI